MKPEKKLKPQRHYEDGMDWEDQDAAQATGIAFGWLQKRAIFWKNARHPERPSYFTQEGEYQRFMSGCDYCGYTVQDDWLSASGRSLFKKRNP